MGADGERQLKLPTARHLCWRMKQVCFSAGPPPPTVCDACIPPFAVDRSTFASLARVDAQFPIRLFRFAGGYAG